METIICDGVEIEIDDFSKLIFDQIITMSELLEYKRQEFYNNYYSKGLSCFTFLGNAYDIIIEIYTDTSHIKAKKEKDSRMRNSKKLADLTGSDNFETLENVLRAL